MEELMTKVLEWIPSTLRPYVAIALLILYVVTKVRSMLKSNELDRRCKTCPAVALISKILVNRAIDNPPKTSPNVIRRVIDIIF